MPIKPNVTVTVTTTTTTTTATTTISTRNRSFVKNVQSPSRTLGIIPRETITIG